MKQISRITAVFLFVTVLFASCRKEMPEKYENFEGQTVQNQLPKDDPEASYQENAVFMDSVFYELQSTDQQIQDGLFIFNSHDSIGLDIQVGDVFMYTGNGGYLREVVSIKRGKRGFILETIQASLAGYFKKNTLKEVMGSLVYDFSLDETLYEDGPESIKVSGNLNFTTGFDWDIRYDNGLNYFKFMTDQASLKSDLKLDYEFTVGETYIDEEKTLASKGKFTPIAGIPFITTISLVARVKSSVDAELKSSASGSMNSSPQFGAVYSNGAWSYVNEFNPVFSYTLEPPKDKITGNLVISIVPVIEVKVLNLVGPEAEVVQSNTLTGQVSIIDEVWQIDAVGSLDASITLDMTIFDEDIENPSKSFHLADWEYFKSPAKVIEVSGNDQDLELGKPLAEPLKIKVVDSYDNAQSNVKVRFVLGANDGTLLTASEVKTNDKGEAEVEWAPKDGESLLKVEVKTPDGEHLEGSPLTFRVQGSQSVQEMLYSGIAPSEVLAMGYPKDSLYWKLYLYKVSGIDPPSNTAGGLIFHMNADASQCKLLFAGTYSRHQHRWARAVSKTGYDWKKRVGTSTTFGSGLSNTNQIIQTHNDNETDKLTAAQEVRRAFQPSVYYLPSKDEVEEIIKIWTDYKDFSSDRFKNITLTASSYPVWTSSEDSNDDEKAWVYNMNSKLFEIRSKAGLATIWAVVDYQD